MILTCQHCQNTFIVDDQLYAQQGGALCEQCHIPLVPVQTDNQGQQNQWNQQQNQWNQQQNQWNQQQNQWNQQQNQWNQQQNQWNQQQNQWNQQQNQWNQNAQWGQSVPGSQQNGAVDAQWGQQPSLPPMDAQWGQQPVGVSQWGTQEQWSQMADRPAGAPAPYADTAQPAGAGEKTTAFEAWSSNASVPPVPPASTSAQGDDDDWNAWKEDKAEEKPTFALAPTVAPAGGNCVVIGKPMLAEANEGVTRQIDARDVQRIFGDRVNPVQEFYQSIPKRYLIAAAAIVGCAIIGFIIGAYLINKPEEAVRQFSQNGDLITEDTPEYVKSFEETVNDIKSLSPAFIPIDGDNVHSGSIVSVVSSKGVFYNEKRVADIADIDSGREFLDTLYDVVHKDSANMSDPLIFLFDDMVHMSVVYRVLYSFGASGRKIYFGGTTQSGISTIEVTPCGWPDHDLVSFGECKNVSIDLKITRKELTLRRVIGDEPLVVTPDGESITELSDNIIGEKVRMQNITPALARMRASQTAAVKISPDGDITYGVFMNSVLELRGSLFNPNVKYMHLAPVPLM